MAKIYSSGAGVADIVTLLVPDKEPVRFLADLEGESLNCEVLFDPAANKESPETSLKWETRDGVVRFTFFAWDNVLGTTTTDPVNYLGAKSDGSPIQFLLMHHKVGVLNKLVIQFVVGKPGTAIGETKK